MSDALQWGGRFADPLDPALLAFSSSLKDDLVLAPFDVACSRAHVLALCRGGVIAQSVADDLLASLETVAAEITAGTFATYAVTSGAEDVHGAIDARVRALSPASGDFLHAGRSRNDQVATSLLLYARDRAQTGKSISKQIARHLVARAEEELVAGTLLSGTTHWQPAQPILLAFWLAAGAEMFVRAARQFERVVHDSKLECPLGSAALAGSCLNLDRHAAANELGFAHPSRNALDAIGNRDVALDAAHACVRAVLSASRLSEELVLWCTPSFGYAKIADAASTGSSLMPQKRNPDMFELVRSTAALLCGQYAGTLATTAGLALSYHRDLQLTKGSIIAILDRGLDALGAFLRAFEQTSFNRQSMNEDADRGYALATDVADALIGNGVTARAAHALVGAVVTQAETEGRPLDEAHLEQLAADADLVSIDAPLSARASVEKKCTYGSTSPAAVRESLDALRNLLHAEAGT